MNPRSPVRLARYLVKSTIETACHGTEESQNLLNALLLWEGS